MQAEEAECRKRGGVQERGALKDLPVVYAARAQGVGEEGGGKWKESRQVVRNR